MRLYGTTGVAPQPAGGLYMVYITSSRDGGMFGIILYSVYSIRKSTLRYDYNADFIAVGHCLAFFYSKLAVVEIFLVLFWGG
jgi:hypothetical protein